MDGGITWPSVPEAAMVPVARRTSYPCRSMVGSAISVMVITVAPTIPVEAASRVPTRITAKPSPPRTPASRRLAMLSRSSATRERSRITPISTNRGTAISVWLCMIELPSIRLGKAFRKESGNTPSAMPRSAKISATPPSVSATG